MTAREGDRIRCGNKKERREEGRLGKGGPSHVVLHCAESVFLRTWTSLVRKTTRRRTGQSKSRGDAEEAIVSIREEHKERFGQEASGGAQKREMTVLVGISTMKKGKEGHSEAQERRYSIRGR